MLRGTKRILCNHIVYTLKITKKNLKIIVGIIDLLCCDELDTLWQIPHTRTKTKRHRKVRTFARFVCENRVYIIVLSANRSSVLTVMC
jgi:hypothetical protein